ncbi:extracellular solute-binding protein [Thalassospiraceae bacterium LMO-JJ14]|nr:extracellular solute-binding protein [Thalassospiraceae bacterium LMO-JJ14]
MYNINDPFRFSDLPIFRVAAIVALLLLMSMPSVASDLSGRLIIVTSFPEHMFERFISAFQSQHPKLKTFVRSKKTSAAISFIQERESDPVDIIWASAPDAFEVLKKSGHLAQAFPAPQGENHRIGGYPLDDLGGYYRGFAVSGYGIMWNTPYLEQSGLPVPRTWDDLRNPVYAGHLGISAPSRSGTMHLIIETILQGKGWDDGWAALLEIGGNLATVTARSFGVLDGVRRGRFGAGPVIDFFGLSAIATGAPVGFVYPDATVFLPANIALVTGGENPEAAKAFVQFILSPAGQEILLEPEISRLPVLRDTYKNARPGFPNPYDDDLTRKGIPFNTELSRTRYHLVNALFDAMITYRLRGLTQAWNALHEAEAASANVSDENIARRLAEARHLLTRVPVSSQEASDLKFASGFVHRRSGLPVPSLQVKLEAEWERMVQGNHEQAIKLSREILGVVESTPVTRP